MSQPSPESKARYKASEKGKAFAARYRSSAKGKVTLARAQEKHQASDKYLETKAQYNSTSIGSAVRQHAVEKWQAENPDKVKAGRAVKIAVRSGRLSKPSTCQECGFSFPLRQIHGHHPDYSRPLDVRWLCPKCHKNEHKEQT